MSRSARQPSLLLVLVVSSVAAAAPATQPAKQAAQPAAPAAAAAGQPVVAVDAPPAAARAPLAPVDQVRELHGQEYSDAVNARDNADLLRAAYEQAHRRRPGQPAAAAKAADAPDVEFDRVAAAYRQAIARYPGTEFECYCRLRLAGAFQFRGQFDVTLDETKQAAERFAGTKQGMEATQAVGLTYLQALHDPAQAAAWFQRLSAAANTLAEEPERAKWQAAAREGFSRCELEEGKVKK